MSFKSWLEKEKLWQGIWVVTWVAFLSNVAYLLWPTSSPTIIIRPHPETLRPLEDVPIVVEAPNSTPVSPAYLLMTTETTPDGQKKRHYQPYKTSGGKNTATKKNFTGTVNLNTASLQQLQLLPGIGPKMAQRIVAYRQQVGSFQSVEQLLNVSGIGPKKLENLRPFCKL